VSFEKDSDGSLSDVDGGDMRAWRVDVVLLTKARGSSRGDGAELDLGQLSVKPAGSCLEGSTRKLKEPTPWCILLKWSVASFELNR
jgi:hypothetical protein